MKTVEQFQNVLTNNLTLIAAAGMAIGTIALCCAFCNTEGCSPGITLDVSENPVCDGSSVGATAYTTCDDEGDTVQVLDSLVATPATLDFDQIEEGTLLWQGSVPLAHGNNKLIATNAECGQKSSEVDVPCNGGSGSSLQWSGTPICNSYEAGWASTLTMCCLTPNTNYFIQEAVSSDICGSTNINSTPNPVPFTTDSSGCGSHGDTNTVGLGGPSECGCTGSVTQNLTITDSNWNIVGTFTDIGSITYAACPDSSGTVTVAIGGDGGGDSMTCPP